MSETEHTPGPWVISKASGNVVAANCPENGGDIVCEAPSWAPDSMYYWESNARLICAAPDLLEACVAFLEAVSPLQSHYDAIRAAVEKATAKH